MEVQEAIRVFVPDGQCRGWPLESVIRRRFSVFAGLVREADKGGFFHDFREAIQTLAADEEIAGKLEAYKRQKKTEKINLRHYDNWINK